MKMFMASLMIMVTVGAYVSYVPQIYKLLKTKISDGISITSWIFWVMSAFFCTIYAAWLKDLWLIIASTSEFLMSLTILILSIRYRIISKDKG